MVKTGFGVDAGAESVISTDIVRNTEVWTSLTSIVGAGAIKVPHAEDASINTMRSWSL